HVHRHPRAFDHHGQQRDQDVRPGRDLAGHGVHPNRPGDGQRRHHHRRHGDQRRGGGGGDGDGTRPRLCHRAQRGYGHRPRPPHHHLRQRQPDGEPGTVDDHGQRRRQVLGHNDHARPHGLHGGRPVHGLRRQHYRRHGDQPGSRGGGAGGHLSHHHQQRDGLPPGQLHHHLRQRHPDRLPVGHHPAPRGRRRLDRHGQRGHLTLLRRRVRRFQLLKGPDRQRQRQDHGVRDRRPRRRQDRRRERGPQPHADAGRGRAARPV